MLYLLAVSPAFAAKTVIVLALTGSAIIENPAGTRVPPPRHLQATETLVVGASARANLLVDGVLVTMSGPGRYTLATLSAPAPVAGQPPGFLDRIGEARRDTQAVGASRGVDDLPVLFPVPEQVTDDLSAVTWSPSDTPHAVVLRDADGGTLAALKGVGHVDLALPPLQAGTYTLLVDTRRMSFDIATTDQRATLAAIGAKVAELAPAADAAERRMLEGWALCELGWHGAAAARFARLEDEVASRYWLAWVHAGCPAQGAPP